MPISQQSSVLGAPIFLVLFKPANYCRCHESFRKLKEFRPNKTFNSILGPIQFCLLGILFSLSRGIWLAFPGRYVKSPNEESPTLKSPTGKSPNLPFLQIYIKSDCRKSEQKTKSPKSEYFRNHY